MQCFLRGATLLSAILMVGCAPIPDPVDSGDNSDRFVDDTASPLYGAEADGKSVTKTYYVSNPISAANAYTGCASALRLTATGSGITSIVPTASGFTFDSLVSGGTAKLYDTWFTKYGSTVWDKDYASSTGYAMLGTVKVKVTGTTVSSLSYWFTDSLGCVD